LRFGELDEAEAARVDRVLRPDRGGVLAGHVLLRRADDGVAAAVVAALLQEALQLTVDGRIGLRLLMRQGVIGRGQSGGPLGDAGVVRERERDRVAQAERLRLCGRDRRNACERSGDDQRG